MAIINDPTASIRLLGAADAIKRFFAIGDTKSVSIRPLLTSRIERDVLSGFFGVLDSRSGRLLLHFIDHAMHKVIACGLSDYRIHVLRKRHGRRLACEIVGASVVFARQLPNGRWQTVYSADFAPDYVVYE